MNRFTNKDSILTLNIPQYGQVYTDTDYKNLHHDKVIPIFNSLVDIESELVSELHIFSANGDFIGSAMNSKIHIDTTTKNIFVDVREIFNLANITRGQYKLVFNLLYPVFGQPDRSDTTNSNWPVLLREVSPEKNELKLSVTTNNLDKLQAFRDYVGTLNSVDLLNNLSINFGQNNIYKILNVKFDRTNPSIIYIKLYQPIDSSIQEFAKAWVSVELMDSYVDTVLLTTEAIASPTTTLKGPNFRIDSDGYSSQSTIYQSWDDLLDSDLPTSTNIINSVLSGSSANLNIDYTDFANFVFYSRAEDRIEIFKSKLEQLESYAADNLLLTNSTASLTSTILSNVTANESRKNKIITSFTPFENWLYNHGTGSLFTHGVSGSITPWPKRIVDNKYVNYSTTASVAVTWYDTMIVSASMFDERNHNSLWWSIPEHLLMTDSNSNYVTFVNMIGEHFDTLYSYTKALTQIHERDEHPEVGASNNLLEFIAKSYGWDLQDTRQLSSLWLYKLGTDQSGSMFTSSNMPVNSHESQTHQIWKRTVNNLPYILKTKGTDRSVKALMSIYGIPQTLLSIKEYGGPGLNIDRPILAENRFAYALNVPADMWFGLPMPPPYKTYGVNVQIPQDNYLISEFGYGNGAYCGGSGSIIGTSSAITTEFRFATETTASNPYKAGLLLYRTYQSGSIQLSLHHSQISSSINHPSSSISGSGYYGRLVLETFGSASLTTGSYSVGYSDWLPLFDGDFWTVRLVQNSFSGSNSPFKVDIARASDCLYGRISHSASFTASLLVRDTKIPNSNHYTYIGNYPSNNFGITNYSQIYSSSWDADFEFKVQEYKEYWTEYSTETFYEHVLNPSAYHTDSVSGSYYSLLRYHPFGGDVQRFDHTVVTQSYSSHPNRNVTGSLITFNGFTGTQATQYVSNNETYYISVPSFAGRTIMSDKIRLDDSTLQYDLSPTNRSEESHYDRSGFDSNKLAIVFSLADQVNRDIANHMGLGEIDSWVGSPADEFENEYAVFKNKSYEYWQKYTQPNNLNSFIRLLSLYDYTFFEQTKQVAPGRADLITGILVEPSILERSKVQISKRPTVTNPQYADYIDLNLASGSGDYLDLKDTIPFPASASMNLKYNSGSILNPFSSSIKKQYNSGSINLNDAIVYKYDYTSGSIIDPWVTQITQINSTEYCDTIEITKPYSGSTGCTHSIIDVMRPDCRYKKKTCLYEPYDIRTSLVPDSDLQISGSWIIPGFLLPGVVQIRNTTTELSTYSNANKNKLRYGLYIDDSLYTQQLTLVSGSRYIVRMFASPSELGIMTGSLSEPFIQISEGNTPTGSTITVIPYPHRASVTTGSYNGLNWVREYKYDFTSPFTNCMITVGVDPTPMVIYSIEVYPYITPYEEQWYTKAYQSRHQPVGCKLESHYYQIDECSAYNRSRFVGSKLTGPGINIDSPNTIDGGPVIEVREVNPNILLNNKSWTEN